MEKGTRFWPSGFRVYPILTIALISLFRVNISRHSISIVVAFFPFFLCAFCMRLLDSIHDEMGNRSFACWFCLDSSLEIAVQTERSKGVYKGDCWKEVCRLFGRQKHICI